MSTALGSEVFLRAEDEYVGVALEAAGSLQRVLDKKRRALEDKDYDEVYRLAGIISLLATEQERRDREMHMLLGSGEEEDES